MIALMLQHHPHRTLAQLRGVTCCCRLHGSILSKVGASGEPRAVQTFLQDGRVEIDSNRVENLIRPIALNRKNALFAGHDEGGIARGRIASLIETCKINGIEPFAYLKATLTAIANGHPQSRLDDLLPWNFTQSS